MMLTKKKSLVIAGIAFLACSGTVSAAIESFSRAHCAFPTDVILNPGKLRNESITWDPDEFLARPFKPVSARVYYGLRTRCDVLRRHNNTKFRPTRYDIELRGIHSAVTGVDPVSQVQWRVKGKHFRRPPNSSPTVPYTLLKDTSATNCNLHPGQFLGSISYK